MAAHTTAAALCYEFAATASSQGSGLTSSLQLHSSPRNLAPSVRLRHSGLHHHSSGADFWSYLRHSGSGGLWSRVGRRRNLLLRKELSQRGEGMEGWAAVGAKIKLDYTPVMDQVNELEPELAKFSDDQLREMTRELKRRAEEGESLDFLLPEALALFQEASKRVPVPRHNDVQLIGMVLDGGQTADMETSEWRALATMLSRALSAVFGQGMDVITANDDLGQLDSEWIDQVHGFLTSKELRKGVSLSRTVKTEASVQSEVPPQAESGEAYEGHEKVIVSTTRNSKTAKVVEDGLEYVSERYIKGSVKYHIELEQSFRLGVPGGEKELEEGVDQGSGYSVELEQPSVSGREEGGFWSSETYLRQLLMQRKRSKQVVLNFNEEYDQTAGPVQRFVAEGSTNSLLKSDEKEKPVDEDERILRKALKKKREIAEETLESAIRAAGVGPTYCRDVMARLSPFLNRIVTEAVYLKKLPTYKLLSFNSRARLYLDQCQVVALIKWLKHQNLTVPRIGSLICLADENLERIRPRVELLKSIYVHGRELGAVIEREPSILSQSIEELQNTVKILENAGIERKWLGLVVNRSPGVFAVGNEVLLRKISMFVDLGIPPEDFGRLVFKFPAVLGHLSLEEMRSKVDYLRRLGIEDDVLRRMIMRAPQLLACSIEESWDRMLRYFYYLQIEITGVRRILGVQPEVFCLNLEENIAPKVRFLQAIRVDDGVIGQVIVNFPAILTYSLDKKIRPVVRFLLEGAGVAEERIGKVIALKPQLIGCSLEDKLQPIVKWFGNHRIPPRLLGGMIANFPALLMYSKPALDPKIRYFKRVMKRPLDDLIAFPRYFSYSLKTRIIPRHELLKKKGLSFSLKQMLACNDETFHSRVAAAEVRLSDPESAPVQVGSAEDLLEGVIVDEDEI
ncbi:hypothetical protein R1flu_015469 [Riccia fluitans]|uniref:chloroplast protein-transporting ATPase n=1 Tax=Riccia fluitans TaxID=41844 RepID=A0ABD1YJ08_9MARC